MECDDGDDPFAFLIDLCQISDSQQEHLRRTSFAGVRGLDDDSGPPRCSRCRCLYLPEYYVPPRRSPPKGHMHVSCDSGWMDGARVVDLGRDTDLGFSSEVLFSHKLDQDVNRSIAGKKEFCDSGPKKGKDLSAGDALAESSSKRLEISEQILDLELPAFSTGTTREKAKQDLVKFYEALKGKIEQVLVEMNSRNTGGESSETRKSKAIDNLESSSLKETETIQSVDMNENIWDMGFTEALDVDLEIEEAEIRRVEKGIIENSKNIAGYGVTKLQETANSHQSYRLLPPWSGEKNVVDELDSNRKEVAIQDVLKFLKDEKEGMAGDQEDDGLANLSILEILEQRGMTFPRPSWWPEGGFEESEEE